MIRLIATDVDGTLLNEFSENISDRNVQALRAAKARGIYLVIASGRPYEFITILLDQLPFIDFVVYGNGAGIFNEHQQAEVPLDGTEIKPSARRFIAEILRDYPAYIQVQSDGKLYVDQSTQEYFVSRFMRRIPNRVADLINITPNVYDIILNSPVQKLNVEFKHSRDRGLAYERLNSHTGLFLSSSWGGNLEINSLNATKGKALETLAHRLKLDRSEIMTIGDNYNDIDMIEYAGLGVAVKSGVPELKKIADYVTKSNVDDGVAVAIEKFALK